MFRSSDERRVQAIFDAGLPPPYEAEIAMSGERRAMKVFIRDPDQPELIVAAAEWWFDDGLPRNIKQPADKEIESILSAHVQACTEWPARKAAEAVENAEKQARETAQRLARAAAREQAVVAVEASTEA